jgi:hypothetical protein
MRDWLIILTPIASALYLGTHPDQFHELMEWFNRFGL